MTNEKIESLDNLTQCRINSIIHSFGENRRIFQSEAQFQFELAWAIQQQIANAEKTNEIKVLLEVLYAVNGDDEGEANQRKKRSYADIVIKDQDGRYIVIELKYKVKESQYGDFTLPNQGASNIGRYDYLWDLHRIENMREIKASITTSDGELNHFERGFAIILTNEQLYWNIKRKDAKDKDGNEYQYAPFCIGDGDTLDPDDLTWQSKSRQETISIKSTYEFKWKNYCNADNVKKPSKSYDFQFLTLEVKSED